MTDFFIINYYYFFLFIMFFLPFLFTLLILHLEKVWMKKEFNRVVKLDYTKLQKEK